MINRDKKDWSLGTSRRKSGISRVMIRKYDRSEAVPSIYSHEDCTRQALRAIYVAPVATNYMACFARGYAICAFWICCHNFCFLLKKCLYKRIAVCTAMFKSMLKPSNLAALAPHFELK